MTSKAVVAATILARLLRPSSSSNPEDLPALHPLLQLSPVPFPDSNDAHSAPPTYPASAPPTSVLPYLSHVYPSTIKRLFLSCGLLPLYDLVTIEKNKVIWVGEKVVREGIKGPTVDIGFTKRAREAQESLRRLVRSTEEEGEGSEAKAANGEDALMRDAALERAEIGRSLSAFCPESASSGSSADSLQLDRDAFAQPGGARRDAPALERIAPVVFGARPRRRSRR